MKIVLCCDLKIKSLLRKYFISSHISHILFTLKWRCYVYAKTKTNFLLFLILLPAFTRPILPQSIYGYMSELIYFSLLQIVTNFHSMFYLHGKTVSHFITFRVCFFFWNATNNIDGTGIKHMVDVIRSKIRFSQSQYWIGFR